MRTRAWIMVAGFGACLASATGCSDADTFTLGTAEARINMSRCYGASTHCDAQPTMSIHLPAPSPAKQCSIETAPAYVKAWVHLEGAERIDGSTGTTRTRIAIAPDDTLWAAWLTPDGQACAVEHRDRDGNIVLSKILRAPQLFIAEAESAWVSSLAVSAAGNLAIGVSATLANKETFWIRHRGYAITQLTATGKTVDDWWLLDGAFEEPETPSDTQGLTLHFNRRDSLQIAAEAGDGPILAELRPDGTVDWIQTGAQPADRWSTAYSESGAFVVFGDASSTFAMTRYDAAGNASWVLSAVADGGSASFGLDDSVYLKRRYDSIVVLLYALDAKGKPRWVVTLPGQLEAQEAVLSAPDAAGHMYLSANQTVVEIAPDEQTCRVSTIVASDEIADLSGARVLYPLRDGSLYYLGSQEYGRLSR